jgi:hypothetical protein
MGVKAKAVPLHATKALGWRGGRVPIHTFSTSALDGGEWSVSRPSHALALGKGPPVIIVQEAGLDTEATGKILSPLPGIETRSHLHPAHS